MIRNHRLTQYVLICSCLPETSHRTTNEASTPFSPPNGSMQPRHLFSFSQWPLLPSPIVCPSSKFLNGVQFPSLITFYLRNYRIVRHPTLSTSRNTPAPREAHHTVFWLRPDRVHLMLPLAASHKLVVRTLRKTKAGPGKTLAGQGYGKAA